MVQHGTKSPQGYSPAEGQKQHMRTHNDRRSGNARSSVHASPKKAGAGASYTWTGPEGQMSLTDELAYDDDLAGQAQDEGPNTTSRRPRTMTESTEEGKKLAADFRYDQRDFPEMKEAGKADTIDSMVSTNTVESYAYISSDAVGHA